MPYSIKLGDVFATAADVLVIPHSTEGTLTDSFRKGAEDLKIIDRVPQGKLLGEVTLLKLTSFNSAKFRYVAFACCLRESKCTISTLLLVGRNLGMVLQGIFKGGYGAVALPLLGSGLGKVAHADSYKILYTACNEITLYTVMLDFFTRDESIFTSLSQLNLDSQQSSHQLAFESTVIAARNNAWIAELAEDAQFYFSVAVEKFQEFTFFNAPEPNFYQSLLDGFTQSRKTFQSYFTTLDPGSPGYAFLRLCGELVAYIDKNAYNKNEWNMYPDKRTLAKSAVRQTNWITNLLKYKINSFNLETVSPSIRNAIKYLLTPAQQLTILSENYRNALYTNILRNDYATDPQLLVLFGYLSTVLNIEIKNVDNTGALYSRILNLPEVQAIWLPNIAAPGADDTEPDSEEAGTEASGTTIGTARARSIEATIHSDLFSDEDLLNYNSYARSIARFITHPNTRPPLTVGILAPWGKGKTTLMKLIEKNLKEIAQQQRMAAATVLEEKGEVETTFGQFKGYLKERIHSLLDVQKHRFPTIWFNAWNFQKNEQVWAGFAHEIIHQLIGQLPGRIEQEKAWLALNLQRVDRQKIRSKVHSILLKRLVPAIFAGLLSLMGWFCSLLLKEPVLAGLSCIPFGAGLIYALITYTKINSSKLDFDLSKYVRQPAYEDKLGYLHSVKEDLRLALELLVDKEKPAIIFIDDLDRCTPATTTELVESINSFISGDLPYCYFILGQDAQMVAAALDVTYKEVGEKLGNLRNGYGSLGWFFMEKFMQLQFNIPIMQDTDSRRLMQSLLNTPESEEEEMPVTSKEAVDKQADRLIEKIDASDNEMSLHQEINSIEEQLLQFKPEKLTLIKNKIVDKAAGNYSDDDVEVINLIEHFSAYLTTSPRMVKRFVNLYRFHRFIQFTGQNKEMLNTDATAIGKWIIIMIKWPQLVRAIQWDAEKDFQNEALPSQRAANFEKDIADCLSYESWLTMIERKYKGNAWLMDKGLYDFLKIKFVDRSSLKDAIDCRFW